jgi:hypothetical protein
MKKKVNPISEAIRSISREVLPTRDLYSLDGQYLFFSGHSQGGSIYSRTGRVPRCCDMNVVKNDQLPLTHALHPFKNSENTPQSEKFPQSPKTGTKMTNISKFTIKSATSPTDLVAIKHLFTAYASALGIDLSFQSFTTELDSLPGLYSSPSGALFLALTPETEAIGCVGLRPLLKTSKSALQVLG